MYLKTIFFTYIYQWVRYICALLTIRVFNYINGLGDLIAFN